MTSDVIKEIDDSRGKPAVSSHRMMLNPYIVQVGVQPPILDFSNPQIAS